MPAGRANSRTGGNKTPQQRKGFAMQKTKPVRYVLSAYAKSGQHPELSVEAATPFACIGAGDELYLDPDTAVVVRRIEHKIWEGDDHVTHQILVNR